MKHLFKVLAIALILFSCKTQSTEYIGPAYVSAPDGFVLHTFTGTPSTVNFTTQKVLFNAGFSHKVTWILKIIGQSSGAVHEIRGTSQNLVNVEWTGTHDGNEFFKTGETAIATLSFLNSTVTASTSIDVGTTQNFSTCGSMPKYGDFENPSLVTPVNAWHAFSAPSDPNVQQGIGSGLIDYNGNVVPSVQGNNYYYIRGVGDQQYYVSGVRYGTNIIPVMPSNPKDVWINLYIYGTGDTNTQLELEFTESDATDNLPDYQEDRDDAMVTKIVVDHVGWKLYSLKYSNLTPSTNIRFGGSGNKIHEPHRLMGINFVLIKRNKADSPVEIYFDYPIITKYGPFKPCK